MVCTRRVGVLLAQVVTACRFSFFVILGAYARQLAYQFWLILNKFFDLSVTLCQNSIQLVCKLRLIILFDVE